MLNKALQTTLALCSLTVYVVSLLVMFAAPWRTEHMKDLLYLNYSYEHRASCFIILVIFLTFPDFLAIILYLKNKRKTPEMNHQFSSTLR